MVSCLNGNLFKWQFGNMASCLNGKLLIWQFRKMAISQNGEYDEMAIWQTDLIKSQRLVDKMTSR